MMRKTIVLMLLAIQTLACSGGEASAVEPSAGSGNTSQGAGSDQGQDSDPTPDPETTFYVSSADELKALGTLKPGTVVYLQAKKGRAARLVDKYVAEGGETLWEISQRFAVKLSALEKMNGVDASYLIRPEDTIVLR